MSKSVVVYYTWAGHTREMAEIMYTAYEAADAPLKSKSLRGSKK